LNQKKKTEKNALLPAMKKVEGTNFSFPSKSARLALSVFYSTRTALFLPAVVFLFLQ
jgi:hypothetical protein